MDKWEIAEKCDHNWDDENYKFGKCMTPYCYWHSEKCFKCGLIRKKCGCGFMNEDKFED